MKTCTILTIGDPHFKKDNISQSNVMVAAIVAHASEIKPDAIVVLGDTLHLHGSMDVVCHEQAINFLRTLQDLSPLFLLIGNHDRKHNRVFLTTEHGFGALKYWNNTIVVDTPILATVGIFTFGFCPYVFPGRFDEALSSLDLSSCRAVFAHQEIQGCKMGPRYSKVGDPWPTERCLLVSGHIHEYQELGSNMIYPGAPRAVSTYESSKKTLSLFRFSESQFQHERLNLQISGIKKITITIDDKAEATVKLLLKNKDEVVRIAVGGTLKELKAVLTKRTYARLNEAKLSLSYEPKTVRPPIAPEVATLTLLEALHRRIKDEPDLLEIYIELFGEVEHS